MTFYIRLYILERIIAIAIKVGGETQYINRWALHLLWHFEQREKASAEDSNPFWKSIAYPK